jgi:adenosylmethionine-8-amino-7-oxononanoate aminotransferase
LRQQKRFPFRSTDEQSFYQARQQEAHAESRARRLYVGSRKRYLDGSSGAMVCNIGHSNPQVFSGDAAPNGKIHWLMDCI